MQQEAADRRLERARRENLPLPKFTTDLGLHTNVWTQYLCSKVMKPQQEIPPSKWWRPSMRHGQFMAMPVLNKRDLQEASLNKGIASRNFLKQMILFRPTSFF